MRVPSHHARGDISENMMTSMIDVVFLLLIFFVCAAAGNVYELLLPTDLAAAGSIESAVPVEPLKPADEIWVYLTAGPAGETKMRVNGAEYASFGELRRVLLGLAEIAPENPVILDIAPDIEAAEMIRVYDTCRAANFQVINFSARSAPPARANAEPAPDDG